MPATQLRSGWTTLPATTSHRSHPNLTRPSDSQLYLHSRSSFTLRFSPTRQTYFIDLLIRAQAAARVSEDSYSYRRARREGAGDEQTDLRRLQQPGQPCSCIAIGPAVSQMSACTRSLWKCLALKTRCSTERSKTGFVVSCGARNDFLILFLVRFQLVCGADISFQIKKKKQTY